MTGRVIDLTAARAVHKARVLERGIHDRGPWQIEVGGVFEDAFHVICRSRVVLIATFPDSCWLTTPDAVNLYCQGEMVDSKPLEIPAEGSFRVQWNLVAEESTTVYA
jgi:hypothetical protein